MRRVVIIPLLVCVLFGAIPGALAQEVQPPKTEEDNGYSQIAIFAKALELVRQDYVDENKTSYHDLVTAAMKGMLSSLDPHSRSEEHTSELQSPMYLVCRLLLEKKKQ